MANPRYNTQVAQPRGMKVGGRVKKMGGECLQQEKIWLWLLQRRYGYEWWSNVQKRWFC